MDAATRFGTKWQNMDRNCNCYRTPAAADAQTSVSDLLYGRHGGACIGIFKVYADSLVKNYPVGGQRAISGKLEYFNGLWQMSHPDYSVPAAMLPQIARQEPVYPLTAGVTNKMVCRLEEEALQKVPELPEWQLPESLGDLEYISFNEALQRVHHPRSPADLLPSSAARRRLAYDEILSNQLALAFIRKKYGSKKGEALRVPAYYIKKCCQYCRLR